MCVGTKTRMNRDAAWPSSLEFASTRMRHWNFADPCLVRKPCHVAPGFIFAQHFQSCLVRPAPDTIRFFAPACERAQVILEFLGTEILISSALLGTETLISFATLVMSLAIVFAVYTQGPSALFIAMPWRLYAPWRHWIALATELGLALEKLSSPLPLRSCPCPCP
jgi:hypothetical protein